MIMYVHVMFVLGFKLVFKPLEHMGESMHDWERVCEVWFVLMVLAYVGHKLSMYALDVVFGSLSLFELPCAWLRMYACV